MKKEKKKALSSYVTQSGNDFVTSKNPFEFSLIPTIQQCRRFFFPFTVL